MIKSHYLWFTRLFLK